MPRLCDDNRLVTSPTLRLGTCSSTAMAGSNSCASADLMASYTAAYVAAFTAAGVTSCTVQCHPSPADTTACIAGRDSANRKSTRTSGRTHSLGRIWTVTPMSGKPSRGPRKNTVGNTCSAVTGNTHSHHTHISRTASRAVQGKLSHDATVASPH